MKKKKEKQLSHRQAIKLNNKAFHLLFKNYPQMILSRIIFVIWDALTPYVAIYLSALLIEEIAIRRDPKVLILLVIIALISAAMISLISAFLLKWRETQSAGIFFKVKAILSNKMLSLDFADIDNTKTHELLSKIEQNQQAAGWGLFRVIDIYESLISSIFTILGGIVLTVMLFIQKVPQSAGNWTILNHPLFIVGVIVLLLSVTFISTALSNKAGSYFALHSESHTLANRLFTFFGWLLGNSTERAADVRMYRQDLICEKYNSDKSGTFGSKGMFAKLSMGPIGLLRAFAAAISAVLTGCVYLFVCLKAWAGAFSVGGVTQYISSITKVSVGLNVLLTTLGNIRNNGPFLKIVFEFMEIPNRMKKGDCHIEQKNSSENVIEFRNVSFQYPGNQEYVLKNINVILNVRERYAVVGENGSGKTTFIKLLCRMYDPTEGKILLNGKDIKDYDYDEYLSLFSVVFQDFKLFSYPLGQNVAVKSKYNRKQVEQCLIKAGFLERLNTMADGVDTWLYKDINKEGVDLSGGEEQKIALARALYKDSPYIVLDEPTAALDPLAEAEVYSHFSEIVEERTAIYISHRLSSCRFCDNILVFDKGKLIQRGDHEKLLKITNGK